MAVKKKSKKTSEKPKPKKEKEYTSMDQLLSDYAANFKTFSVGDKVRGKITEIERGKVLLDIGGKSEGLVAEKAYKESEDFIKELHVGDEIEATVIVPETPEGYTILSFRGAKDKALWSEIERDMEKGKPVDVVGLMANPSGVTVNFKGLHGFIPTSQLGKEVLKNPQKLINSRFQAIVIDFEKETKKIILSEKEVSEKKELESTRKALKEISQGDIYEGEVAGVFDFGCFVKIDVKEKGSGEKVGLEGLVHISELSWEKVDSPSDFVSPGDRVTVKVIGKKGDKLAFSIKQAMEDPWKDIRKKYKKDSKVKGKVVKISDFGAFVSLEPGVEGLVHITKIPPGKKLSKGDEIEVYIEEIDPEEQKISLGLVLTEKPVGYK